jgi:hypothetical protein
MEVKQHRQARAERIVEFAFRLVHFSEYVRNIVASIKYEIFLYLIAQQ